MMKNGVYFIVIALLVAELTKNKKFCVICTLRLSACMLSTCTWNLSRMLGDQELTNACDVAMNPTVCGYWAIDLFDNGNQI